MTRRKARSTDGVEKTNPFAGPKTSESPPPSAPAPPQAAQPRALLPAAQVIALTAELTSVRERVAALEAQLRDEQAGRRADLERLLRELGDLKATIARLEERAAK